MRNTLVFRTLLALMAALALAAGLGALAVRGMPATQADAPQIGAPVRSAGGDARAPAISFIDSASPTCYAAAPGTGACYVEWEAMYVEAAAGSYIISMTVSIDDRVRAHHSGFFQRSMYIPGDLVAPGYRVACGAVGSGALPGLGATYRYAIRARDTDGLTAANHGAVTCPADTATAFLPLIRRR